MSTTLPVGRPLEDLVAEMPAMPLDPQTKTRLVEFCHALDAVGRFDDLSQQAYIDEEQYRLLINTFSSSAFTEELITRVRQAPGNIIRPAKQVAEAVHPITWLELASHVGEKSPFVSAVQELGLNASSTSGEIQGVIKRRYPDAPAVLFEPDALYRLIARAIDHPSSAPGVSAESGDAVVPDFNSNHFLSCLQHSVPGWVIVGLMGAVVGGFAAGPAAILGAIIGFCVGFMFMFLVSLLGCFATS